MVAPKRSQRLANNQSKIEEGRSRRRRPYRDMQKTPNWPAEPWSAGAGGEANLRDDTGFFGYARMKNARVSTEKTRYGIKG